MKRLVILLLIGCLGLVRSEASPQKKSRAVAEKTTTAPKTEYVRFHNETAAQFNDRLKEIFISRPLPDYPYHARLFRFEGKGWYRIILDPNGRATAVEVIQSAGKNVLDDAAKSGLREWRAKPGPRRVVELPVTFTLQSSPRPGGSDPHGDQRLYAPAPPPVAPGNR